MNFVRERTAGPWARPGYFDGNSRLRNAWRLFRQLFQPPDGHRIRPTSAGIVLILLALAVGTAAFNTSNNILYLGLSLLLGSLLVSGVMSWLNFYGCRWQLQMDPHGRVGESLPVAVELVNDKRWLPTYGLGVSVCMDSTAEPVQRFLEGRLGPGDATSLEILLHPARRGTHAVTLKELYSSFPFGFLRKAILETLSSEVLVWAPRIDYTVDLQKLTSAGRPGNWRSRQGSGSEFLHLREYRPGDPQRMVDWKTTARTGRLFVRETVAEASSEFILLVEARGPVWTMARVDRLSALASTLAEDLYMAQRLGAVLINGSEFLPVRRLGELHQVLDRLARLTAIERSGSTQVIERWVPLSFRPRLDQIEILNAGEVVGVG